MPPRRTPSRLGLAVFWGLVAASFLGLLWFASIGTTLAVGLAVAAFWIIGRAALARDRKRLAALAATREGESICHFARSFDRRSVGTCVIRAVYETLQQELDFAHPAFPVRASDALQELFSDPEDLDMTIAPAIARRAGRSLANVEANPYYGKVECVTDLVMFFNVQPMVAGQPCAVTCD